MNNELETSNKNNNKGKCNMRICIKLVKALIWTGVILFVFLVVIYFINFYSKNQSDNLYGLSHLGGILAGSVGTLWSLAGVILIYFTFLKQEKRLDNLEKKRKYSQFETKFFNLLTAHNDIKKNLVDIYKENDKSKVGDINGIAILNKLQLTTLNKIKSLNQIDRIRHEIKDLWQSQSVGVNHYFRQLQNTVLFVKKSDISNEDKTHFMEIVKNQLSDVELVALFYYRCISDYEDFNKIYKEYGFGENTPIHMIQHNENNNHWLLLEEYGFKHHKMGKYS